jgi:hypothetical protein
MSYFESHANWPEGLSLGRWNGRYFQWQAYLNHPGRTGHNVSTLKAEVLDCHYITLIHIYLDYQNGGCRDRCKH